MRQLGLIVRTKRLFGYFVLLILGISLMFYGVISYFADLRTFESRISDDEIIMRAKALGLVEVKELIGDDGND
ncbi:MAG TPA: hypothetical protein DCG34_11570 [Clostridiales bacterium]|nr:hypothetical protein [Clostridiales bacterium]